MIDTIKRGTATALLLSLIACGADSRLTSGGGGGGGGNGGGGGHQRSLSILGIVSSTPTDNAVQVALDAQLEVEFDGVLVPSCLNDPDTRLVDADGKVIDVQITLATDGRRARFRPRVDLAPATDYVLWLSPLTCDVDARILEYDYGLRFRTLDTTPPTIANTSIRDGQKDVARRAPIDVEFDEAIDAASVRADQTVILYDVFGTRIPITTEVSGKTVRIQNVPDLGGLRNYAIQVRGGESGVTDRAGNPLRETLSVRFTTEADVAPPTVLASWPDNSRMMSPRLQPELRFNESVDPLSVEASSVEFIDQFGGLVAFRTEATTDQRLLRFVPLQPLQTDRAYTATVRSGPAALTDVSGLAVEQIHVMNFRIGTDDQAPAIVSRHPEVDSTRISINSVLHVTFDGALDPGRVNTDTVRITAGGSALTATVELENGDKRIAIRPVQLLAPKTRYTVTLAGGQDGIRDAAGNPLASTVTYGFETAADATLPTVLIAPSDGGASVGTDAKITAVLSAPIDPATFRDDLLVVRDAQQRVVSGTLRLQRANRVLEFKPTQLLAPSTWYTVRIAGGPSGLRETSGNWLAEDFTSRFHTSREADQYPPSITVTLNDAHSSRKAGMAVPPSGFALTVSSFDPINYSVDLSSIHVELTSNATGTLPTSDEIFAASTFSGTRMTYLVQSDKPLPVGDYEASIRLTDLAGRPATAAPLAFRVTPAADEVVPFERTQVVWARTDLDRNGNGRPDFEDDGVRLGLLSKTDPQGTNEYMTRVIRDAIFAQTHELFGREASGRRLDEDSVALRVVAREPIGLPHMQIALGGLDPEGNRERSYGDRSTGVLGRAYYDYRNDNPTERNLASQPGLGVFPGELFLYEAELHLSVYPAFTTAFARKFLNLSPHMGGTPAGEHALDGRVLHESFEYATGTANERARYTAVFAAIDDWAAAVGVILAHEVGHSVGLTAAGSNPQGLHGDNSLHNAFSNATDVMGAAVGYDSLISLNYSFRDLNIAYLRHRLVLR